MRKVKVHAGRQGAGEEDRAATFLFDNGSNIERKATEEQSRAKAQAEGV